jgi:type IX secretion system PorP/SprF family membrane protein
MIRKIFIRRLLPLLMLLPASLQVNGQKDALYYQYMFNHFILNPAYSGVPGVMNMYMVDRYQWVGIPGAPNTIAFSIHTPIRNERVGVGGYIYADRLGPMGDYGVMANYAYRVKAMEGMLSFGIQFGVVKRWINWDLVDMEDLDDIYLLTRPQPRVAPDVNFGILYYNDKFFAGLSSKHLLEVTFADELVTTASSFSVLSRHFYGYTGTFVPLSPQIIFKPTLLLKYVDDGSLYFDLNAMFLYRNTLWLGASFRSQTRTMVFLIELYLNKKFRIGYSYDTYLGDVRAYNIGSHEFMLGYTINLYKEKIRHPFYF